MSTSMNPPGIARPWTIRRALAWAALLACGFALAAWLRYGVIQPEEFGIRCGQAEAPGWCTPRQWLILAQHDRVWGWVGLTSAAAGLFLTPPPPLGRIAIALAGLFSALALILYNATLGAPALVLMLLALLRR
ncbi:MAG: hypothetical protein ACREEP_21300 [Dongiaceae bacterium]